MYDLTYRFEELRLFPNSLALASGLADIRFDADDALFALIRDALHASDQAGINERIDEDLDDMRPSSRRAA